MSEPLLSVKNMKKTFQANGGMFSKKKFVHAVNDVSFDIYPGETFSLVGESGCGKSTTGKLIDHLITPDSGEIWFEVHELLGTVGLSPSHGERYPHEFSGGQRQRIGIARALTVQPKLIIADEPVSALDVSIQAQVLNLLQQLQKDFNLTYLFISHDLSVVEMISDRIGVMYLGTIVETAPKKELYANPRHPYTRALLSAVPIPDPEVKKERITLKGDLPSPSNPPSGCLFHTRCPHCTEKCKTQVPTPVEIAPGHIVKCHYPELTE